MYCFDSVDLAPFDRGLPGPFLCSLLHPRLPSYHSTIPQSMFDDAIVDPARPSYHIPLNNAGWILGRHLLMQL